MIGNDVINIYTLDEKSYKRNRLTIIESIFKSNGIDGKLDKDKLGKPRILGANFCISISHSERSVFIALSKKKIGIDAEVINKIKCAEDKTRIIDRSYLKFDMQNFSNHFLLIWTIKESFVKYCGIGLRFDLKEIHIDDYDQQNNFFVTWGRESAYCKVLEINNHFIAICTKDKIKKIELKEGDMSYVY